MTASLAPGWVYCCDLRCPKKFAVAADGCRSLTAIDEARYLSGSGAVEFVIDEVRNVSGSGAGEFVIDEVRNVSGSGAVKSVTY